MGTLSPDATLFYVKEIKNTRKKLGDSEKILLISVEMKANKKESLNEIDMKKLIKIYERVTE